MVKETYNYSPSPSLNQFEQFYTENEELLAGIDKNILEIVWNTSHVSTIHNFLSEIMEINLK